VYRGIGGAITSGYLVRPRSVYTRIVRTHTCERNFTREYRTSEQYRMREERTPVFTRLLHSYRLHSIERVLNLIRKSYSVITQPTRSTQRLVSSTTLDCLDDERSMALYVTYKCRCPSQLAPKTTYCHHISNIDKSRNSFEIL